jgi:acyl carrier protein
VRPIDLGRTHHDLSLTTWLGADGPAGILEYASELLEVDSAARWLADFEGVLHALVEDPAMPVGSLPVSVDWGRPRRAVPHPAAPVSGAARPRAAPSAPPESGAEPTLDALASIWRSVLELDEVAPFDNFLDVGGDSLLALQVIDRTETELGVRMAPGDLFTQTLAQLAASLEARRG